MPLLHSLIREGVLANFELLSILQSRIVLVVVCVAFPILWGVVIHWIFSRWLNSRDPQTEDSDEIYSGPHDYQI